MVNILVPILFFTIAFANILSELFKNIKGKIITKPFLMPLLLLMYILYAQEINIYILLALLFSFLGDIFLLLDKLKQKYFILGLVSFAIGHIFYILTFLQSISNYNQFSLFYLLFILPYLLIAKFIYIKLNPYFSKYKLSIIIYGLILIMMSFTSLLRFLDFTGLQLWLPFIGSILFIISDVILAFNFLKIETKYSGAIIMFTYILAQLLIIMGIAVI